MKCDVLRVTRTTSRNILGWVLKVQARRRNHHVGNTRGLCFFTHLLGRTSNLIRIRCEQHTAQRLHDSPSPRQLHQATQTPSLLHRTTGHRHTCTVPSSVIWTPTARTSCSPLSGISPPLPSVRTPFFLGVGWRLRSWSRRLGYDSSLGCQRRLAAARYYFQLRCGHLSVRNVARGTWRAKNTHHIRDRTALCPQSSDLSPIAESESETCSAR